MSIILSHSQQSLKDFFCKNHMATSNISLSVIIPVYNTVKYLDECIDSLLNQSLKNIELIFVDNGSQDGCYERLWELENKLNSPLFKVFQVIGGRQGHCRNFGIQQANGNYIGFCDSDDWVAEDMFELLYKKACELSADICFGQVVCTQNSNDAKRLHYNKYFFKSDKYITSEIPFLTKMTACYNKIFRRDLLIDHDIRFLEGVVHEDVTFNYKAFFFAEAVCSNQNAIYFWRQHLQSTTKIQNRSPNRDVMTMITELRSLEKALDCNADWRLASDRLIENHMTYLVKGVDPRKLKSFLEELLAAAGFIPYTVFLKLKPYLNAEQLGQEIFQYYQTQKRYYSSVRSKLEAYKKYTKQLIILLTLSVVLNLLLVVLFAFWL